MTEVAEKVGNLRSPKTCRFSALTFGRGSSCVSFGSPRHLQKQWDSRRVTVCRQQESTSETGMARAQGRAPAATQEADTGSVDPPTENDGTQQCHRLSRGENR